MYRAVKLSDSKQLVRQEKAEGTNSIMKWTFESRILLGASIAAVSI